MSEAAAAETPSDAAEPFGMTVLALRLSNLANGVSKLHGEVSRHMWKKLWPDIPAAEVPITSITNGVHSQSWVSPDLSQLYDRYQRGETSDERMARNGERVTELALRAERLLFTKAQ